MTIVLYVIIFWFGCLTGVILWGWMSKRFRDYSGTIVVETDEREGRTLYSLILDEYPDKLEFKKEVIFRVDTSEQSSDRE